MVARRIVLALFGAWLLASLTLAVSMRSGPAETSAQGQGLEGSWMLATTFADGRQTRGLATYDSNGSYVFSTSNFFLSNGHGAWVRTGDRQFATTWVALRFDQTGAVIGTQRVRGQLTLGDTADSFSTRGQVELLDREGNIVGSDSNTSQGTRIRVEPLP
jgi:hypothetical protein